MFASQRPKTLTYCCYYLHRREFLFCSHFGVVAVGETTHDVKPAEDMAHGQFYSIEEVEKIFADSVNDVEKWTIASWPFIKDYLSKL